MVQIKDYSNLKPFIITKPLIVFFTILAILFPWHSIRIMSTIDTNWDFFFFIFRYILLVSVCLNFLLLINKDPIYRYLGTLGYYIAIINVLGYIIYFIYIVSVNFYYITQFYFDFGFYFFISVVGLVISEFFLYHNQLKKQSTGKSVIPQIDESPVRVKEEQKLKSDKMKKGLKSLSKTVGKIAVETVGEQISEATGDMISDKLTEITGNADLGGLVGKFTEKGLSTLSEKAIDKASEKLSQYSSNLKLPLEQVNSESLKIDYKKALLGLLKTKQHVQIEYIQSILKLTREHIIGIIYELVGEGEIEGVFNLDDTEFTLKM